MIPGTELWFGKITILQRSKPADTVDARITDENTKLRDKCILKKKAPDHQDLVTQLAKL